MINITRLNEFHYIDHWYIGPMIFPKAMAFLALPISKKFPWDKFLEETLRALANTLRVAAPRAAGVTTLGSCAEF
jgi:hypothetical protein